VIGSYTTEVIGRRELADNTIQEKGLPMDLHAYKVWLPGAASFLLFLGFYLMVPGYTNFGWSGYFMSIPYLAVLPFVGALGAHLSRRMNGSVVERIVSALFTVFTFAALFAVRIVYGLFFEGKPYTLPHFLRGLLVALIFTIVGGLFLVLGAWPFCRSGFKPSDSSQ
jgi:hypothetical protein